MGHSVPTTGTDDIVIHAITEDKMADDAVSTRTIEDGAVTEPKIANGAVTTPKIKDGAVTLIKLSPDVRKKLKDLQDYCDWLRKMLAALENEIATISAGSGIPISTIFGSSDEVCVSQKAITNALQKLWAKLEEITGEAYNGVTIDISPTYYIGEEGCTVTLAVSNADAISNFDFVRITIDGVVVKYVENVSTYNFVTEISDTATVKCEASLLGTIYSDTKTVRHYPSFWLGAGSSYSQIMNVGNIVQLTTDGRANKDVTVGAGQHIYVVINTVIADYFTRADINGVEIPFGEPTTATIDGVTYNIYTSENVYSADTYNIDINS